MAAPAAEPHRFYAHAADDGRSHAHLVPGAHSLQDAALRFVEHWSGGGEVRVIARDGHTGEERCFCVDVDGGDLEPCG